jgi:hypothetical protein
LRKASASPWRCRLTWKYLDPISPSLRISVRAHSTTLYRSRFRFEELLANHRLLGASANHSPVRHARRLAGGRLFDHHLKSFERVLGGFCGCTPVK